MKSYKEHLRSTNSYGETQSLLKKPTLRSSAVFPLIHKHKRLTSIFTFMGYWLKKREIKKVLVILTTRDAEGSIIFLKKIEVDTDKSYVFLSSDLISGISNDFIGSLEIEIFSIVDMVFPFPAITFAIKGINGLTFVHTCGRIYNNFDDLKSNQEDLVPETGFDLLCGKSYSPFFSFINGPIEINNKKIYLEYFNEKGEKIIKSKVIKNLKPYGLGWIKLSNKDLVIEKNEDRKIGVKIKHNFEGFFPRFIAGNILNNYEDISLTHSYYDSLHANNFDSIWKNPSIKKYNDSVIALPFDTKFSEIELAIYPIFTKSPTSIKFELYNSNGKLINSKNISKKIATSEDKLTYIRLFDIFKNYIKIVKFGMVKVILNGKGRVPMRMKFGLNFIRSTDKINLPSNVCFGAQVSNEKMLNKPKTFRWCTLFDVDNQKIILHNTSFLKKCFREATIEIEACREIDNKKLKWLIELPYNSTIEVLDGKKKDLKKFLKKSIGWISFTCSSPFILGYYITDYGNGVIGADHLY